MNLLPYSIKEPKVLDSFKKDEKKLIILTVPLLCFI